MVNKFTLLSYSLGYWNRNEDKTENRPPINAVVKGEEEKMADVPGFETTSTSLPGYSSLSFCSIGSVNIASPIKAVCITNIFCLSLIRLFFFQKDIFDVIL